MSILTLNKISIRLGDKWILKDCSVELNYGEIFGVSGFSASGKTTLFRIIAGLEKKHTGEINFNGKTITYFGQTNSKWKNLFKSDKDKFSVGERQKLEIETILNNSEPQSLLIFDNAFANFDQIWRENLIKLTKQTVEQKQLTILLTTHSDIELFEICNRIGILHKGEIIQIGTPKELYENPKSVVAASLIGRNNLLECRRVTFNNQPIPEFQTLVGEHRLQTGKAEKSTLGTITSNVTLAIRPEHISISFGASFPEDNLIKAKVAKVNYLGAITRVLLDANGLMLEALVLRLVGLNIGDECMVGIPPDRLIILKD